MAHVPRVPQLGSGSPARTALERSPESLPTVAAELGPRGSGELGPGSVDSISEPQHSSGSKIMVLTSRVRVSLHCALLGEEPVSRIQRTSTERQQRTKAEGHLGPACGGTRACRRSGPGPSSVAWKQWKACPRCSPRSQRVLVSPPAPWRSCSSERKCPT